MIPMDALGFLDGSYIKINDREQVFYFNKGEWLFSTKNAQIVRAELKRKKNPFRVEG